MTAKVAPAYVADSLVEGGNEDGATTPARHDRPALIGFVADGETERTLREGLAEFSAVALDIRRGGIRSAMAAMRKDATPRTLIIDIGGEAQPLTALAGLAEVVEPDVQVLVIGTPRDVDFYRQVTRGLGAAEYLPKPLANDIVARHFAPLLAGQVAAQEVTQGGRFLTVTGVRGGSGATTIAAYLAWHFAVDRRRHTILLDPDLRFGDAAMLLGARVTGGLRTAVETPARIDELFIERSAQSVDSNPAADRLAVLAGEERLTDGLTYAPGAAARLIRILQRRYSFVVGDVPLSGGPFSEDLMGLAHQRILVMEPSLSAIRDTLRLMAVPNGPLQKRRPIIILNRAGKPGGLTRQQVEDGLKIPPDLVIGDLPKQLGPAAILGLPDAGLRGEFRKGIVELARQAAFERLLESPERLQGGVDRRRDTARTPRRGLFGRAA